MKLEFAIERIDLSVNEQSMRLLGNNELVANSVNYVYAHFRFPDEWKDLTKQVHFKQALPTAIHLILFLDGNNSVLVPHEVLDHKGEFTVHLVGTGNGVTITTNPLTVYIRDNGLLTPDNNATPTPDFLIESVARVKEDRDAVEADREHVDELAEQLPQIIAESIVPAAEKAANEVKESIISTVQETADSAVETVNTAKDNAISTITTTSESAVNSVTVIKTTSLNAIENARGEVMEELGELVGQATSEADRATTKATEANASAVLAGEHETSARGYSTSAGASATTATTKANEAKGYAESASADASSVASWNNKVYVGNTAPSESNVSIWINPDEDDPPDIVEQVNQQSDDIVELDNRVTDLENKPSGDIDSLPLVTSTNNGKGVVGGYNVNYGIGFNTVGVPYINQANNYNITTRANYIPIVPANLDFAVKSAMCDGKGASWTDEEKASARERMSAYGGEYKLITSYTFDGTTQIFEAKNLKLKKLLIVISNIREAQANTVWTVRAYKGSSSWNKEQTAYTSTITLNSTYNKIFVSAELKGGIWFSKHSFSYGAEVGYVGTVSEYGWHPLETTLPYVEALYIGHNASGLNVPANTVLEVYGVE